MLLMEARGHEGKRRARRQVSRAALRIPTQVMHFDAASAEAHTTNYELFGTSALDALYVWPMQSLLLITTLGHSPPGVDMMLDSDLNLWLLEAGAFGMFWHGASGRA